LPKLNLKKMSVAELAALRNEVQAALVAKIEAEQASLQGQLDGLSRLANAETPRRRGRPAGKAAGAAKPSNGRRRTGKVPPKYRGPKGELWTGRGRSPRWLAALEADGKKRDSYLIK
jgi:DNA-binding protein H-NS